MKKLINNPEDVVKEELKGIELARCCRDAWGPLRRMG